MKKLLLIVLMFTTLFITGCGNKLKTYEEVDYKKLMNMFDEKESFVLFIGSTECTHCDSYKVTLNDIIEKYQVKIYYIDISKLSKEEDAKLRSYANFTGTPTTVFIEKGTETSMYDRIDGNKPIDKVIEKLKKKGYIK